MRFASFRHPDSGVLSVGVVRDDTVFDITEVLAATRSADVPSPMRCLIHEYGSVRGVLEDVSSWASSWPLSDVALEVPVPDPSKVVAAPVNYVDHKVEMSAQSQIDHLGVFLKAPSSLLAPGGTVRLPYVDRRFDQEGELAVVIGRQASQVSEADAAEYVFGYTCLLDITMRGGEDRSTRKSFDTFTPMGPWIVTPDEFGDPSRRFLKCSVSGVTRQRASFGDLIWSVPRLVAYVSSVMTLYVGDVITTGTPAGVGALTDGDQIVVEIDGIGPLAVSVSAQGADRCPTLGATSGPVPPPTVAPAAP